jgi:large subunit ribosomal protein L22
VTRNPITTDLQVLESMLPPATAQPELFFPEVVKAQETPNPVWRARKLNIHYSVYKLNAACRFVRGKHIYDAMTLIQNVTKKGGKIVKSVLEAARVNGIKQGFAEDRMWVKEVVLGKKLGPKKIDIKAKGKFGIIHAPRSHITVVLEEKSIAHFYKLVVSGKAPPAVGHVFRKMLYQNDSDFERVRALSHMTTSRGRYYRRTQFKRMVQML